MDEQPKVRLIKSDDSDGHGCTFVLLIAFVMFLAWQIRDLKDRVHALETAQSVKHG